MMRWLLYLVCAFIAGSSLVNDGLAATSGSGNWNPQVAGSWCYGLMSGSTSGAFIEPLVQCFTDTTNGIIPSVTTNFLTNVQVDYLPVVGMAFMLAIVIYGMRIMLGHVREAKRETIVLGFKMAGIMYFLNNAPALYIDMVNILQSLSLTIANTATTLHTSGFCNTAMSGGGTDNSQWQWGLWSRWDCVFDYIFGFAAGDFNSGGGFAIASIASFLMLMIFSMGTGILIFFFAVYLIFSLIFAALRFIHMYLMAVLALSFMFCIGYIFVPFLLFRSTYVYFQKWMTITMGLILTPVMMFAFMGMSLVAIDIALFSGTYSVYCMIGGPNSCGTNTTSGANLFKGMTSVVDHNDVYGALGSGNPNLQMALKDMWMIALNGPHSIDPNNSGAICLARAANGGLMGARVCNISSGGFGGTSYLGSNYENNKPVEVTRVGLDQTALNLNALASGAGSTCTSTLLGSAPASGSGVYFYNNCPYLQNILISILVAALLVYILYSLLSYLPTLATDLVSQGTSSSISLFQSPLFGQKQIEGGLDTAKNAALSGADSAQNAAGGAQSTMGRFMDSLLSTGSRK